MIFQQITGENIEGTSIGKGLTMKIRGFQNWSFGDPNEPCEIHCFFSEGPIDSQGRFYPLIFPRHPQIPPEVSLVFGNMFWRVQSYQTSGGVWLYKEISLRCVD